MILLDLPASLAVRPAASWLPARPWNGFTVADCYCCDGGAGMGYWLAGFDVIGIDQDPHPAYPFRFVQGDALTFITAHGSLFDFVHASPPCQGEGAPTKGSNAARNHATGRTHPHLIGPTRDALRTTGRPSVMENVPGSTVRKDIRLCGEMFSLGVLQHRYFELDGWSMPQPVHLKHRGRVRGWRHGEIFDGPYVAAYGKGGGKATVPEMQAAKHIHWTDDHLALREAIPPAYTRLIGRHAAAHLGAGSTALPAGRDEAAA
ncbi:DNA methylase [Streptacidiphilus sp. EB103A]|uniref:DNA methylase n=1 Tax=Streptacidiphilus sp. EB103A TaxID=3156275 RepID=UPI0035191DB5